MKIFNFTNRLERWKRVEDEMWLVWLGNQSGATIQRSMDMDFKSCMDNLKKTHTLKECETHLNLS